MTELFAKWLCAAELKSFIEGPQVNNGHLQSSSNPVSEVPAAALQQCLLDSGSMFETRLPRGLSESDVMSAALFSADVPKQTDPMLLPQYGLLGQVYSAAEFDQRLFQNTNIPFSTFTCGLQGSGKSHTLSCLLGKVKYHLEHVV